MTETEEPYLFEHYQKLTTTIIYLIDHLFCIVSSSIRGKPLKDFSGVLNLPFKF